MLHLIYIIVFTIIAFLTISNLIRSLISVSLETSRRYRTPNKPVKNYQNLSGQTHPELFDENGQQINEPLLVLRSVSVEDAREQLDRLYQASPGSPEDFDAQ